MLEFMSCARPVILGVDGHARKIIEASNAGIFVEPENAAALVDTIKRLAANPSLGEVLGRNGRHQIVAKFSRRQTAQIYISVLNEILGREPEKARAVA
jgi:glycosyltransferase involved in cell wall biosynthesis